MKPYKLSIHIFRRDLRLEDNTAQISALQNSEQVLPIFIFDPRQLSNPYTGNNIFQFLINSLVELDSTLRGMGTQLYFFNGLPCDVLRSLFSNLKVDAVHLNRDYTPFSIKRDEEIASLCTQLGISFCSYADALLTEPEQVHKPDGTPYSVFTPFMKKARQIAVPHLQKNLFTNYFNNPLVNKYSIPNPSQFLQNKNNNLRLKGGRLEAIQLLNFGNKLDDYSEHRNLPAISGTSLLSAHHKFGTISIRETYHKVLDEAGAEHTLIGELYWRDFFTHVGYHFPKVFGNAFHDKYQHLNWTNKPDDFERWCGGTTGFPIVDAGIRELISTGFMHNRVRMVVASFLTKDLHIDWRWGEKFFANHLIDYDPAVNNGNWQWAASTGCDTQPYFRIFNPWSQQKKFDPNVEYIKKWVPELRNLSPSEIHNLENSNLQPSDYPRPMVNHSQAAEKAKQMFKQVGQ